MKSIENLISEATKKALTSLYNANAEGINIALQQTRKEFEGDLTITVFAFTQLSKKNPEVTGKEIGEFLKNELKEVEDYNVIKGFLNLVISKDYWLQFLKEIFPDKEYGLTKPGADAPARMIEYSCPNTNKPLHLGHIRNNLIGFSISRIVEAAGNNVIKVNLINDRGIHICKSMLAWQKWGNGETPESAGLKGDHVIRAQVPQVAIGGDHRNDSVRRHFADLPGGHEPVLAGHLDVHDHNARPEFCGACDSLGRRCRGADTSHALHRIQRRRQQICERAMIINDQNGRHPQLVDIRICVVR